MSKKMLKRSLALGALMAFVITGSAMAMGVNDFTDGETYTANDDGVLLKNLTTDNAYVTSSSTNGIRITTDEGNYGITKTFDRLKVDSVCNAIYVQGKENTATNTIKASEIELKIDYSGAAILNEDKSHMNLEILDFNNLTIEATESETGAHGIRNHGYGYIEIKGNKNSSIDIKADENAVYTSGYGGSVKLEANQVTIESLAKGESAEDVNKGHAIVALASGDINIKATNKITLTAVDGKKAIYASGTNADNATVNLWASGDVDINGVINAVQGSTVDVTGYNVTIDSEGENQDAINSVAGKVHITAKNDLIINAVGDADGVQTCSAKDVVISADNKLQITAGAWGVNVTDANNDVKVKSKGDIEIKGTNGAVRTPGISSKLTLEADGNTKITGNVLASGAGSSITANFSGSYSFLTGTVNTADTAVTTLTFKNNAVWNNTGASKVAKLSLTDGVINQNATDAITIASYSGNGTINYGEGAGKVYIDNGFGKLTLAMDSEDDLEKIAEQLGVKDNTLGITTQIVKAEGAVTGEQITEVKYDEQATDGYYLGTLGKTTEKLNTTNASINNTLNVALMAWRAENNDMNKRLGELRNANGEHGVWVRMVNGESEYKDVENEYKTYQLGYDEKLSVDPSWTVGAAVSYTEADTTADKASGENKHKGFSVYGSKLNDDGSFVDLIAKVARVEHDFNVAGDKGDWSSNGYSLSAEYGKRLEQGNGLWIEPQVELTYGKISSAECELAGRNVTLEDMESLVGRVGFSLGKDIKQGNIYARASYLYDFEGETTTKFSDGKDTRSFEQDLGGGWWEVGVGANINLSKATYIYADVEKTFGGEVDTNWQWNLGVRYSF